MPGPAPRQQHARPRDTARRQAEVTRLDADDQVRGRELPPGRDGARWHPATVRWWETWRRSPQARLFTELDWSFLLDTALVHHQYWIHPRRALAVELRQRVAKLGATPPDRARLRVRVEEHERA